MSNHFYFLPILEEKGGVECVIANECPKLKSLEEESVEKCNAKVEKP